MPLCILLIAGAVVAALTVFFRPFGSINELLDAIRALLPPEDYRLLCRITLEGAI